MYGQTEHNFCGQRGKGQVGVLRKKGMMAMMGGLVREPLKAVPWSPAAELLIGHIGNKRVSLVTLVPKASHWSDWYQKLTF